MIEIEAKNFNVIAKEDGDFILRIKTETDTVNIGIERSLMLMLNIDTANAIKKFPR